MRRHVARCLLSCGIVVIAARYAAIALLALAAVAIAAPSAFADSINLLRPATKAWSPSILIDASQRPSDSDADPAAQIDEDCVALQDGVRNSSWRFQSVQWLFGQLAWSWDQMGDPSIVYVLCVHRRPESGPLGGSMQLFAGLSSSRAPATGRTGGTRSRGGGMGIGAESPIATDNPDPTPTMSTGDAPTGGPAAPPGPVAGEDPVPTLIGNDPFPLGTTNPFATTNPFDTTNRFGPAAPFDPIDSPITLDPREWDGFDDMAPVPEPGTWLLMGTGLAAIWRAARRRK